MAHHSTRRLGAAAVCAAVAASLVGCGGSPSSSAPAVMEMYTTNGSKSLLMTRQSDVPVTPGIGGGDIDVVINRDRMLQTLDGFGGAMTHSSATVLQEVGPEARARILTQLFDPEEGAGFQMLRVPIGTSDYAGRIDGAEEHYTLDDMPMGETDEHLEFFSIDKDLQALIPALQDALAINPDLTIIASPWSPPAWMKTTDSLYSGTLRPEYEEVYAEYLVKFVEAYAEHGIGIDYLTVQNEPLLGSSRYPVMLMDEFQQLSLITTLGPKLEAAGHGDTKVLIYDHNFGGSSSSTAIAFIDTILGDPEAAKYTAGVAFHGYDNDGLDVFGEGFAYVRDNFPRKKALITEITEGMWATDFAGNLSYSLANVVLGPLNYSSTGALYWNTVLYDDGTPELGGSGTSLGLISVDKDGGYTKGAAYYSMQHFSRFLGNTATAKAQLVETESSSPTIFAAAFTRPDGRLVVVVHNNSTAYAQSVNIVVGDRGVTVEIAPQSVSTFVY